LRTKNLTCAAHIQYFHVSTCSNADTRHSGTAERVLYTTCALLRHLYFGLSDAPRNLYESLDALSQRPFVRTTIPRIRKIGDCYDNCRSHWREHTWAMRGCREKKEPKGGGSAVCVDIENEYRQNLSAMEISRLVFLLSSVSVKVFS